MTFVTVDGCGRILHSDGSSMVPTGGFVHIIPEELVTPKDLLRQRQILGACVKQFPEYLIGHEAHRYFKEWDVVCKGRVVGYDRDANYWQIKYIADDEMEDYDEQQMLDFVVNRVDGAGPPDGGTAARLRAAAKLSEQQYNPEVRSSDTSASDSDVDDDTDMPLTASGVERKNST